MPSRRIALVLASGVTLVFVAACQPGRQAPPFIGSDTSCHHVRTNGPGRTSPVVEISVNDGNIVVDPDTVRVFPGDLVVWQLAASSEGYGWEVSYERGTPMGRAVEPHGGGETSSMNRSMMKRPDSATSNGQAPTEAAKPGNPNRITSPGGGIAGGVVSTAAACRFYPYGVKVWRLGSTDTMSVDPGSEIVPN